jgi:hypothetical protein
LARIRLRRARRAIHRHRHFGAGRTEHLISTETALPTFDSAPPPFRQTSVVAWAPRGGGSEYGVRTMAQLVIDVLLFSCMFAFVTGIVIAAATLLI